MERSEQIADLITALAKAQAEFTHASKDSSNPAFGSKYADLAANIIAVRPTLSKHGIAIMQFDSSDVVRQTGSVTTSLHYGEQWISTTVEAPAVGQKGFNVQSLGACWTYLRRYSLQALCGLASDDDDGNSLAVDNRPSQSQVGIVQAEVRRQQTQPTSTPSELDWHYNTTTGILLCRIKDVEKRLGKGENPREFVVVKLNGKADGKDIAFCWDTAFHPALMGALHKVVKMEVKMTQDGRYLSVLKVLEVDGVRLEDMQDAAPAQTRSDAAIDDEVPF